ncbi:ribonuclease-like [Notothenia coriiceps]|uniref:Ribonuclease-like n=1 Tax=Notothenia coriiceps TaxID=8208 RepID=A0A6I9NB17_9TELE|nr:PREDICTED: ribonuclease-like [Notothenia coriiceps]
MWISFACLLLLSATVSSMNGPHNKFVKQHIIKKMNVNRCDKEMGRKEITETDSSTCKDTNTFILATSREVTKVCGKAGKPYDGGLTISTQPFPIVVCRLKTGNNKPKCQYKGKSDTRYIVIRCEGKYPVHFAKDVFSLG